MNLVESSANIVGTPVDVEQGVQLLRQIEQYARLSHRSGEKQTEDSWRRFIQSIVLDHGDLSVIEHISVTAYIVCDRGVSHEWVRHRVPWAYTQESTRFCNYGKDGQIDVIKPPQLTEEDEKEWFNACQQCEFSYLHLLVNGRSPQIARSVLPTCLATRIYATANLRGWRHIFLMRTTKEAHPQIRTLMESLLDQFKTRIPLLFDDIVAGDRQVASLKKLR